MTRFAPALLFVLVTALFVEYGRFTWSWVAGPAVGLALWLLERKSHDPAAPAPAHRRRPAPVD